MGSGLVSDALAASIMVPRANHCSVPQLLACQVSNMMNKEVYLIEQTLSNFSSSFFWISGHNSTKTLGLFKLEVGANPRQVQD